MSTRITSAEDQQTEQKPDSTAKLMLASPSNMTIATDMEMAADMAVAADIAMAADIAAAADIAMAADMAVATDMALDADIAVNADMGMADMVFASMAIDYENSSDSTGDDVATTVTVAATVIATVIAAVSVSIPRLVSSKASCSFAFAWSSGFFTCLILYVNREPFYLPTTPVESPQSQIELPTEQTDSALVSTFCPFAG